ncbi:MAG: histidinol dehydrogenase [Candidatus Gottesmanbacteria bacterium]|nr:histidinol dehydrogenase [Candidatus Gottesmanbacteria bacterium]
MNIYSLSAIPNTVYDRVMKRSYGSRADILPRVQQIFEDVRKYKDRALFQEYEKRFGLTPSFSLKISRKEIKSAYKRVDSSLVQALQQMIKNITKVTTAQMKSKTETAVSTEKGVRAWREWRAIEKVGLYIPGGKAVYPSSVLMSGIPAMVAGCKEVILCSPPSDKGKIPAIILVAADMIGISNIYSVGGAYAIAALTIGTESIPKVDKIIGAGNALVTTAKILALETTSIDMPAGPSEVFIIADESANPSYIASDLLADGEHGDDSACVLVTTSSDVAKSTILEIEKQLIHLPTASRVRESLRKYGLVAVVNSLEQAIIFANDYAPEHLEIMTKNPVAVSKKINNAGSVFIGNYTSKSAGDYATGANHILPTGGMAKSYPPLGVDAFGKWMQIQECTKQGLKNIQKTIEAIATVEQLPAHKNSTSIRFQSI